MTVSLTISKIQMANEVGSVSFTELSQPLKRGQRTTAMLALRMHNYDAAEQQSLRTSDSVRLGGKHQALAKTHLEAWRK